MDPISIVAALSTAVPAILKFVKGDDAANKAEVLINAAKEITGIADPKEAVAAVAADPVKLQEFKIRLTELQLEETKAFLADVANARAMQIAALQQDDLFSKRFIYYFATGWSAFAALYFTAVTFEWFGGLTPAGTRTADTILGVLIGTVLTGLFQFFYGSTVRNGKKDETIQHLSRTAG